MSANDLMHLAATHPDTEVAKAYESMAERLESGYIRDDIGPEWLLE